MGIFANKKIRTVFRRIFLLIIGLNLLSISFLLFEIENVEIYILISSLVMVLFMLFTLYVHFQEEKKIMEEATREIKSYISGNRTSPLQCNDEGQIYRLFHEINALIDILNAQSESEKNPRNI